MTPLTRPVSEATRWIYQGIWLVLVHWFKVPDHPPTLPVPPGETADAFRPAEGFLRYLKFLFWVTVLLVGIPVVIGWLAALLAAPLVGIGLMVPVVLFVVVPNVIGYLAIHLRYDSTWYVMTHRSLRIRRGIWVIHETTITFENVQNVAVNQGPLQRIFGIADVHVDTAGGGGGSEAKGGMDTGHKGIIEGISDATRIRDLILSRLRTSRSSGLGDEHLPHIPPKVGWTVEHIGVLREIRDLVVASNSGTRS